MSHTRQSTARAGAEEALVEAQAGLIKSRRTLLREAAKGSVDPRVAHEVAGWMDEIRTSIRQFTTAFCGLDRATTGAA